ncbi:ARID DNA-binding domain-containing protein [Tanacetum coccineum]|uniref:ARID DNA-binding domain-containing protein n=1 Tax=Tanacetum coccineum TaxID=301880 RepID=A0ABQ5IRG2_9ASTR
MNPRGALCPLKYLNILSIDLLKQQGFEISSNEDRCTLAYMFKDKRGKDINLDRMREQHNNYLEDYFDALDRSANIERKVEQPYEKENDDVEIGNFRECVAFLDLIRKRKALSNEWEVHRDKFNRVLTWFFNHFLMRPLPGSLPPIIKGDLRKYLGLERFRWIGKPKCYFGLLEPLSQNYKAARSSNPTGGYEDEGIRRFEDYHGDGNKDGSTAVKEKGRVEHFGITLEKEEEGKYDATAHQDEEDVARIKCYICQRMGHFDTECPNEDQRPTNGASTSRQQDEEDTHSSSSEDFTIIGEPPDDHHVLISHKPVDLEQNAIPAVGNPNFRFEGFSSEGSGVDCSVNLLSSFKQFRGEFSGCKQANYSCPVTKVAWNLDLVSPNSLDFILEEVGCDSLSQDVYLGHVFSDNAATVWRELQETYDRVDGSIMFNLMQNINSFKQGGLPFLMGLDDVYQPIRSSIMTRKILLEAKDAFLIISKEESHRRIPPSSVKAEKP